MSDDELRDKALRGMSDLSEGLCDYVWHMARMAAQAEHDKRIKVLEDEIAELRDAITDLYKHVPAPEPQSFRVAP